MNILLKVWLIAAPIALFVWIKRATVYNIVRNLGVIGGALLDVGCQAFIDIIRLIPRRKKITGPDLDISENFWHE